MFPKSIRWRIQAWHGFLLLCVIGALLVAFYNYERAQLFREIDAQLQATITPLLPAIMGPPDRPRGPEEFRGERQPPLPPRLDPEIGTRPDPNHVSEAIESGRFYYITWSESGEILNRSANAPAQVRPLSADELKERKALRTYGDFREAIHYSPNGGCTVLGTSLEEIHARLARLAVTLLLGGLIILGVALAVGWWIAGKALRPIAEISNAAEKISTGRLSERIKILETESELGQLADVLNRTFEKLEHAFDQQVRFTADASHELRTPISVVLTQIQLALSRERSPEEYRQTLATCERAAERMRTLVNQLLELARHDAGEPTLILEPVDLGRIAREALEFIGPLAREKNAKLTHSLQPISMQADALKLGQVLINLLNNAIVHNDAGVEICLSIQRKGEWTIIRVADNGIGIPPEALPQLFERFFRVDKARSRTKGSSGLGLAISKAIVESHGGKIRAESEPGCGSIFTIELPLKS